MPLYDSTLNREKLGWLCEGDNHDYLANVFLRVHNTELAALNKAASSLVTLGIKAAKHVIKNNLWEEMGIPPNARAAVKYSFENELDNHLINRFDFAGGIDNLPIKFLEFNADTCSLMPETAIIQDEHYIQESHNLKDAPFDPLELGLIQQFEHILSKNPERGKNLLVSTMGNQEDILNANVVIQAAKKAGFEEVQMFPVDKVVFSPEEGIFVDLGAEHFKRYDFWYKVVPWEYMAYEEPEWMDIMTKVITNDLVTVINPVWTMLLQSKAICKIMFELEPDNPYLLKTSFSATDFPDNKYIRKPLFGRMGENIAYHDGEVEPTYETEGDYGEFPSVYQEIAAFNIDMEDHRYQPSVFYANKPCGLAVRRQDDLIIDDDAEFVPHTLEEVLEA